MTLYDDMNPEWAAGAYEQAEWEPWEPDDDPEDNERIGGCHYCGAPEIRDTPDPFGQQPVCDGCFNELIGGDRGDPPWMCGNGVVSNVTEWIGRRILQQTEDDQ